MLCGMVAVLIAAMQIKLHFPSTSEVLRRSNATSKSDQSSFAAFFEVAMIIWILLSICSEMRSVGVYCLLKPSLTRNSWMGGVWRRILGGHWGNWRC
jgi:hypothetical protein